MLPSNHNLEIRASFASTETCQALERATHFSLVQANTRDRLQNACISGRIRTVFANHSKAELLTRKGLGNLVPIHAEGPESVRDLASSKIVLISSSGSIGLARCAWKPANRVRTRSSSRAAAVKAITGS